MKWFTQTLSRAKHWLLLAFALFLAGMFLNIGHDVLYDVEDRIEIQRFDDQAMLYIANLRTDSLTVSMIDLTALGSVTVITIIAVMFLIAFLLLRDYFGVLQLGLTSIGAGIWTTTFKHFAERPRPTIVSQLVPVNGFSFPSGHSLAAAALFATFAIMASRHFANWKSAVVVQAMAGMLIAGVAFSRVYLGVHYPSDVVSGALFGMAWAYFVAGGLALWSARIRK